MEPNNQSFVKMKVLINIIAVIALIVQSIFSIFNILIMKHPETFSQSLYNDFVFISSLCSCIIVFIFLLLYNSKNIKLKNKIISIIFLIIATLATYIHINQLFVLNDMILTSVVLLLIDGYVVHAIWKNLLGHKTT